MSAKGVKKAERRPKAKTNHIESTFKDARTKNICSTETNAYKLNKYFMNLNLKISPADCRDDDTISKTGLDNLQNNLELFLKAVNRAINKEHWNGFDQSKDLIFDKERKKLIYLFHVPDETYNPDAEMKFVLKELSSGKVIDHSTKVVTTLENTRVYFSPDYGYFDLLFPNNPGLNRRMLYHHGFKTVERPYFIDHEVPKE